MSEYLPRRDEDKRVFLIVIFLTSLGDIVGAHHFFEENHIHAHIFAAVGYGSGDFLSLNDIHVRVAGRDAPVFIVVLTEGKLVILSISLIY